VETVAVSQVAGWQGENTLLPVQTKLIPSQIEGEPGVTTWLLDNARVRSLEA